VLYNDASSVPVVLGGTNDILTNCKNTNETEFVKCTDEYKIFYLINIIITIKIDKLILTRVMLDNTARNNI